MLRHRSGQVFIEYIMIVLLVCMAILIGGPALKRSLFGAFKIQEDTVMDSFSEQIRQSASSFIPPPACGCSPWIPGICGTNGCALTESSQIRTCTPIDCMSERQCIPDHTCCTSADAIPLGCGTLVAGNAAANPNVDVNLPVVRGAVYADNFNGLPAGPYNGPFDGTIYIGGNDTHDCLVGQLLVTRTCGLDSGGAYQGYACLQTLDACRPGCWGTPAGGSAACDAVATNEYDRAGNNLDTEVSYRKHGGVIASGVPDDPNRPMDAANNSTTINPAYILPTPNPYNAADNSIYLGAYLMPWTYFTRTPAGGLSPLCNDIGVRERKCERVCQVGDIASDDRLSCATPRCEYFSVKDKELAINNGGIETYISPKSPLPENFLFTVESFNLNYIVGCFDEKGDLIPATGVNTAQIFPYPNAGCTSGPFTVSGKGYCFQDLNVLNPGPLVPTTATTVCPNSNQVALRMKNPSPKTLLTDPLLSNDYVGYRVDFQIHNIGAMVSLLVDDYVDIYASNSLWTRGRLLHSVDPVSAATLPPWQFPREFFAPGGENGNIYLIAVHRNAAAGPPAGLSLQKKNNAFGAGCFAESPTDVPYYNTGGQPIPGLNNGCWIVGAGLNTMASHTLRLSTSIPGSLNCNCGGACAAGSQYCIANSCVPYNPILCTPDVAFISSFETPPIPMGSSAIQAAGFDLWPTIAGSGLGVELEYQNPALTYPPPLPAIPIYAGNGNQYLQMASVNGAGTTITSIPFTTQAGYQYNLSFYHGLRSDAWATCVNDSQVIVTLPTGGNAFVPGAALTWQIENITFWGTGGMGTMSFTDWDVGPPVPYYVDDSQVWTVSSAGAWTLSTLDPNADPGGYLGEYVHDGNAGKGAKWFQFNLNALCGTGLYTVEIYYPQHVPPSPGPDPEPRATSVPVTITATGVPTTVNIDESLYGAAYGTGWFNLGNYTFTIGNVNNIRISNAGTTNYVVADAIRLTQIPTIPPEQKGALIDEVVVRKICPGFPP